MAECVLRDIDFDARRGTVTGVLGPVGSGKSTLLMALLKELMPESGFVVYNNDSVVGGGGGGVSSSAARVDTPPTRRKQSAPGGTGDAGGGE